MEKMSRNLKEMWWLLLILIGILVLILIPAEDGMPSDGYKGCDGENSVCYSSTIKSITKESDGSTTLVVPIKSSETETKDASFHLKKHRDEWMVGNKIFMSSPDEKRVYLFIGSKTNLFMVLLWHTLGATQGATAVVDLTTMQEIDEPDKGSLSSSSTENSSTVESSSTESTSDSHQFYESRGYECTDDCSGHDAGYEWAEDNDVCDDSYSDGKSNSFDEGVQAYAEDNC